ncbi:MAG: Uma2 family endonuclease, partial [Chloroflexi bacterium]|nr:Uma2 family endonuclease [Chloroflexota bacterium]
MALAVAEQNTGFTPEYWPLENGDRLDQAAFHARYEAMPEDTSAELIEGVVYMASPVGQLHAALHAKVMVWLGAFEAAVPEVRLLDNPTIILGPESEPQPDAVLRLLPSQGGSSRDRG